MSKQTLRVVLSVAVTIWMAVLLAAPLPSDIKAALFFAPACGLIVYFNPLWWMPKP